MAEKGELENPKDQLLEEQNNRAADIAMEEETPTKDTPNEDGLVPGTDFKGVIPPITPRKKRAVRMRKGRTKRS
jgi:hypothetical protein